ncbi:MAG: hypothetical protein U0586_10275 [Candidatus Brocadiaceae bacterium]
MAHCTLSLRAERSNLSLINKLYLLIAGEWGCKKLTKKKCIIE